MHNRPHSNILVDNDVRWIDAFEYACELLLSFVSIQLSRRDRVVLVLFNSLAHLLFCI